MKHYSITLKKKKIALLWLLLLEVLSLINFIWALCAFQFGYQTTNACCSAKPSQHLYCSLISFEKITGTALAFPASFSFPICCKNRDKTTVCLPNIVTGATFFKRLILLVYPLVTYISVCFIILWDISVNPAVHCTCVAR